MKEIRPRRRSTLDPFATIFMAAALFLGGIAMITGDITIPQNAVGGTMLVIAGLLVLTAVIVSWVRARRRRTGRSGAHEAQRQEIR